MSSTTNQFNFAGTYCELQMTKIICVLKLINPTYTLTVLSMQTFLIQRGK